MILFELVEEYSENFTSHYWRVEDQEFIDKIFKLTNIIISDKIEIITLQDIVTYQHYTIYRDEISFWIYSKFVEVVLF